MTFAMLYLMQRRGLRREHIETNVARPVLTRGGQLTAAAIGAIAVTLLCCSALDIQLGLPTFACGLATSALILAWKREAPWALLSGITWSVLPLVAGLFVLVEVLAHTGVIATLRDMLAEALRHSTAETTWIVGIATALICNVANNLPAGLVAGSVVGSDHIPGHVVSALLIAVDLGPNLSVTGSLATILWLAVLRREGLEVGAWAFLKLGVFVMPPALVLALAALMLGG
jgi:arsenical pump membrane protein